VTRVDTTLTNSSFTHGANSSCSHRKYGAETEVFDFRMYKHEANSPLSATDIYAIANEPIPPEALEYFRYAKRDLYDMPKETYINYKIDLYFT